MNKRRMYNNTYKARKLFPALSKKRNERIFSAHYDLAREAASSRPVQVLMRDYGFTIQITM